MHFLVFMYLLVVIVFAFVVLCRIFVAFIEDAGNCRWEWIPLHLVTGPVVTLILLHYVGLMVKFINT